MRPAAVQLGQQIPRGRCGQSPLSWSPDFGLSLLVATPPSGGAGRNHIALVDLQARSTVDLTEARQGGSGFSTDVLDDLSPGFVSDIENSTVSFGSHLVLFKGNGIPMIVDVRSPAVARPVDITNDSSAVVQVHPEYRLWLGTSSDENPVSPDGSYIYYAGPSHYCGRPFEGHGAHQLSGWRRLQ